MLTPTMLSESPPVSDSSTPAILTVDDGDFLTCVIDRDYAGLSPGYGMIHGWNDWAFCISPFRIHAMQNANLPNGSYRYSKQGSDIYLLEYIQEMDEDIAKFMEPIERKMLLPLKLVDVPNINITAARSLSRQQLVACFTHSLLHRYVRWTSFIFRKSLEASVDYWSVQVDPLFVYDAYLKMDPKDTLASMTSDMTALFLWSSDYYATIFGVYQTPKDQAEARLEELIADIDAEVFVSPAPGD